MQEAQPEGPVPLPGARGFMVPAVIMAGACAAVAGTLLTGLPGAAAVPLAAVALGGGVLLLRRARMAERAVARTITNAAESKRRMTQAAALQTDLIDAVNSISEGFVLFGADGRLILCNERYRRAYPDLADLLEPGITFDALLRHAALSGAHDPAQGPLETWVQHRLRRHLENPEPVDCRLSDGNWYRISEHPTDAGGVVKVLMDISELKRHEQDLAESEARYRHLVERAPYGILMTRDGEVGFANAAARAILADAAGDGDGTTPSPVGQRLADLLGTEPPEVAAGGVDALAEHTLTLPGRPDRHLLLGRYPLAPEGGAADLVVVADITDRRSAELALQQAQKMDAIGQLAGGIAHEFNNMLTAIGGFARMGQRQLSDTPRVAACLEEVTRASDRAAVLTAQLLDFSRRRGQQEAVVLDAVDTVQELKSFLRPVLGETVSLSIEARVESVKVAVDPARFTQAVVNLAINGRDAIQARGEGGGALSITVDETSADPALHDRLPSLRGDRFAVVEVTDNGTGIAPEHVDRIFEPFFTTKAQGKGTGLGLPMVYGMATQAGGAVEVDGRPGEGARFRLLLPAVETPATEAAPAAEGVAPDLWGTALLAEDEDPVRDYLRLVLEEHGMEVVACANGEEALAVWREEGEGIDVLVCDVVMPGMGGLDLVRAMREDNPDVSVVLVSGYAAQAEASLAELEGTVTFLAKPVDPDRLLTAVRAALEG